MKRGFKNRVSFAQKLGLDAGHAALLAKLDTPHKIQDYLDSLAVNMEAGGDTCLSVAGVLDNSHAHCIEAAFVGAAALWISGSPPLIMDLQADDEIDYDHVVTLFRSHGCWGAISKSNHVWLRWRDPVYRTLRELAMSYFHEYTNREFKTLRTYSASIDLRRFDPALWVTNEESCWEVEAAIDQARHYNLLNKAQIRILRDRDDMELQADSILEYEAPTSAMSA